MSFFTTEDREAIRKYSRRLAFVVAFFVIWQILLRYEKPYYSFYQEMPDFYSIGFKVAIVVYFITAIVALVLLFIIKETKIETPFIVLFNSIFVAWGVWSVISLFGMTFGKTINRLIPKEKVELQFVYSEDFGLFAIDNDIRMPYYNLLDKYEDKDTIELGFTKGILGYYHSPTLNGEPLKKQKRN